MEKNIHNWSYFHKGALQITKSGNFKIEKGEKDSTKVKKMKKVKKKR